MRNRHPVNNNQNQPPMKHPFFWAIALCLSVSVSQITHAQDILWERSLGGNKADYLTDAHPTPDYGFILGGSSISGKTGTKTDKGKGHFDYSLWKLNEGGEVEWQKSYGGSGEDFLQSVALTAEGGYILAGVSASGKGLDKKDDGFGQDDFWIIKLDPAGNEEWQLTTGGDGQEKLQCIRQTRDGGFIVGGASASGPSARKAAKNFGNLDYWVIKLDRKGKVEWEKSFGGQYLDELRSIALTSDGGYLLGGYSNSPYSGNKTTQGNGSGDYWIIKIDNTGKEQWQQSFGGTADDQLSVVLQTIDKGYLLAGSSASGSNGSKSKSNGNGSDFWLVKLDESGGVLWQQTYDYGNYDLLASVIENNDQSLLIGGFARGEMNTKALAGKKKHKAKSGTDDYIALKVNQTGQELWSGSVGSDGEDILRKVIETRDGGYVFAGTSNPQATPASYSRQPAGGAAGSPLKGVSYTNGKNQAVQDAKNDINRQIDDRANSANQKIKDNASAATDKVKQSAGIANDSPVKLGVNDNASPLGLGKVGDGKPGNDPLTALGGGNNKTLPRSGDKAKSYGSYDLWIVKLLDKNKPKPEQPGIEAYPNPSAGYTNVLVGYEYETGTATVVDMAGRVLQRMEITGRTVPVDLSSYPEGIYVVNITTNVQSNGVKVMKKTVKN